MQDLCNLYRRFLTTTVPILDCFTNVPNNQYKPYIQEMCVIKFYDIWERFCRELIFLSAYAEPVSLNGKRIPRLTGVLKRSDVITRLQGIRKIQNRPIHMIRWGDPSVTIPVAQSLGIRNFSNISLALGVTPSPLQDLRHIRNFIAHRNEHTAHNVHQIAVNIGIAPTHDVLNILNLPFPPGVTTFELWLIQIRNIARNAVDY